MGKGKFSRESLRGIFVVPGIAIAAVVLALAGSAAHAQDCDSTAVRSITGTQVSIAATPETCDGITGYVVQDALPAGLTAANINSSGQWDSSRKMVKWAFLDNQPRTLTYTVTGPGGSYTYASPSSLISLNSVNTLMTGDTVLIISPTLTYTAGAGGALTGASPQTVDYGADGTAVTVVADAHYRFLNWTDASTANPRTDTNVTADISVTANFVRQFTLTVTAGTGSGTYDAGTNAEIVAMAPAGCVFTNWTGATGIADDHSASTTILMDGDKTVAANFVQGEGLVATPVLTLANSLVGAGSAVTGSLNVSLLNNVNSSRTHTLVLGFRDGSGAMVGTVANLEALPTVTPPGGSAMDDSQQIAIPTPGLGVGVHTIWVFDAINAADADAAEAAFAGGAPTSSDYWNQNLGTVTVGYTLTTYVVGCGGGGGGGAAGGVGGGSADGILAYSCGHGTLVPASGPQVAESAVQLVATADTCYQVQAWTGTDDDGSTSTTNAVTMTGDKTVSVGFGLIPYTLAYAADAGGTIVGTSPQTVNWGADGTAVTAVPNTGYHFLQWGDGETQNPRTDTYVMANLSVTASFAINTYALTYTAGSNGTMSGTSPQTVNYGANGTAVTAAPNTHYYFVNWSDAKTQNPRQDANVTATISVTANFAITKRVLTYTAGANGSITGTSPQTVNDGANGAAATAVPNTGYHFLNWSDASTQNPRTDTNVTANISVTASFAINTYTLRYVAGTNGSVSGTSSQTVNYGASGAAVTATPNTGYHFVQWSDAKTQNPRTDTNVTASISVTASFAINTYTLTYAAGTNGSISGASPQTVNYGAAGAAVTAAPNTGYHFVQWSDAKTQNPRTDTNVTANISVTASFAANPYTLTYAAGANGSISGTSPQTVNYGAAGAAMTAAPNAGYHFAQWSDSSTQNPRADTNVTANISVTASFAIGGYTLAYAAGTNGTISGTSPQTVNYGANGTAVTAVANVHYRFVNWSDASTQNPRTDANVTANISVTATFAINTYTLTYTAGAGGSITGTNPQTVNYGGSGTAVTAVPNAGCIFLQWSDALTQNPRTDMNVTANITVTASFSIAMLSVPPGTFTMGSTSVGDDATYGSSNELPQHQVALSAYQIGKFQVTNKQYCDVLNWALAQGYLKTSGGAAWAGTGAIYAGGNLQIIVGFTDSDCNIQYSGGTFSSRTRTGLPGTTNYSMDTHPVVDVSWYGSVAFCNWLNQMQGLTPCYDMTTANWPLTVAPPASGGYRLPTEAEWERAAAWDGSKHWIYGFTSDTLTDRSHANYRVSSTDFVNPLGLTALPDTSPVGWFNGVNVSLNGSVTTVNSVSPVGAYDMSGNVWEWSGDWSAAYGSGAQTNPTGPASGSTRVLRGGGWDYYFYGGRSAFRNPYAPTSALGSIGFRVARTVTTQYALAYTGDANGTISGATSQMVDSGGSGTAATAIPNTGYHFVQWSDASTLNPRTDTNVTANISVTATFAINTYTLTYTASANGTIFGPSPQNVSYGANGTAVTAVPGTGSYFVQWSDGVLTAMRTDINVAANISVVANFAINQYALTYTAGANGSITGTSPQTVSYGGDGVAVTAVPNAHYHFVQWSDASTQNPRIDKNVTVNISVTANFAIDTFTLTYTAGANGSIVGTSFQTVNYGTAGAAVTAVPSTGYSFVNWSDLATQNPRTDTNVTANIIVTANFAINTYTLTYTAGPNGSISGRSPQTVNYGTDGAAVTAAPNAHYRFLNWSDSPLGSGTTQNPRADTNVTASISVTANFTGNSTAVRTITGTSVSLEVTPDNSKVTGYVVQEALPAGLTATDISSAGAWDSNNNMVKWVFMTDNNPRTLTYTVTGPGGLYAYSGDGVISVGGIDAPITGDTALTLPFILAYTAGPNGSIMGASPQTVDNGGSGTAVTAAPNTGCAFAQWSDNSTRNPRTDATVTANVTVTANFVIITAVLTLTPPVNGTLTAVEPPPYSVGTVVHLIATPDAGSVVQAWTGADTEPSTETTNTVTMTSDKTVSVAFIRLFPCDINPMPGNKIWDIEANELSSYIGAWLAGNPWPIAPTIIPANYVSRAVAIWLNGEKYTNNGGGEPLCWAAPAKTLRAKFDAKDNPVSTSVRTISGVQVSIAATPDTSQGDTGYVVQDALPAGLSASSIDNGGTWDSSNGMVKWVFVTDNDPRTLTYTVTGPGGSYTYTSDSNVISVNGEDAPITGDRALTIPADYTATLTYTVGANGSSTGTDNDAVATPANAVTANGNNAPISVDATLNGTVTFEGRPAKPNARASVDLDVVVVPPPPTAAYETSVTTDDAGAFTLSGLTPGAYQFWVKGGNTLAVTQSVTLASGDNGVDFGTLAEGDSNGDNATSLIDFSILAATFGKTTGQAGFDPRADFNGDASVTLVDFSMLAAHFAQAGATKPVVAGAKASLRPHEPSAAKALETPPKAPAAIAVAPQTVETVVGQTFDVAIEVRTGGLAIDGAAACLHFDPAVLRVESVVSTGKLPVALANNFDNDTGQLLFAAGAFAPIPMGPNLPVGLVELVTVKFKAVAASEAALLTLVNVDQCETAITAKGAEVPSTTSDGVVVVDVK